MAMTPVLRSMVAATYVADIEASRDFYQLLGFHEHSAGKAATSAWSSLHLGRHRLLLASTRPPLDMPRLPLLFYFFFDDLETVLGTLGAAGVQATRMGHPPHAPGGEAKVLDPDGNTVLLGQEQPSAAQDTPPDDSASPRFSLLKEAAALVAARGGTTAACQVTELSGAACQNLADVKLADSSGHTVWACLSHADEILVTVPSAYLTSQDDHGIAEFLKSRQARS